MTVAIVMTSMALSPKRSFEEAGLEDTETFPAVTMQHAQQTPLNVSQPAANSFLTYSEQAGQQMQPVSSYKSAPIPPPSSATPVVDGSSKPVVKRVRLSAEDKEILRVEKEEKQRLKAEDKARKGEERARKDEERKRQQAARDEQQKIKEQAKEEKQQKANREKERKEAEKRRKEEEKQKKERSQLRLGAFFGQSAGGPSRGSTASPARDSCSPLSSRRSSIAEITTSATSVSPQKSVLSDYERHFPEFFLQSHTVLAPLNQRVDHLKILSGLGDIIDKPLSEHYTSEKTRACDLFPRSKRTRRPRPNISLKSIVERLQGSAWRPIDLTRQTATSVQMDDLKQLQTIPMKSIKFAEDVRPPYIGTYTKTPTSGTLQSLARKPMGRVRPDTNYDYDSEAEWEEPEEGEDITSEGEEDAEVEEEEGEMDEFLDDEGLDSGRPTKRKPLLGDLQPSCSGICWETEALSSDGTEKPDFSAFKLDVLLENPCFPVDPYSTSYWDPPALPKSDISTSQPPTTHQTSLMEPPRMPLHPTKRGSNTLHFNHSQSHPSPKDQSKIYASNSSPLKPTAMTAPQSAKRFIPHDVLPAFKAAIGGSDATKVGLLEILKKQFPKQPKDAIKNTLEAVAERKKREGAGKASEKVWILN